MKKAFLISVVIFGIATLIYSCSKKETAPIDDSNLKVTVSIPSSGFYPQNSKVYVHVIDLANTSLEITDSTTNGGTALFTLNTGNYVVSADCPSGNTSQTLAPVQSNYQSASGNNGQEVQITNSGVASLSFTKWCQYITATSGWYCN